MTVKMLKPVEANDGSYAGAVLGAYDNLRADKQTHETGKLIEALERISK